MIEAPTGWAFSTHAKLALPAKDTLQSFVIQDDGTIIASQGMPNGDREDSYLVKLRHDGSRIGTMIATRAGHASLIAGLAHDRVVFDFAGTLVAADWKASRITVDSPNVERWADKYQAGYVTCSIDRENDLVMFRSKSASGDMCTLRKLPEAVLGVGTVIGKAGPLPEYGKLNQGWSSWRDQLFHLLGSHNDQELISYNLNTGKRLWRLPLAKRLTNTEPEGVFVSGRGVIDGNPLIYIGGTRRIYSSRTAFTREHRIFRLRDRDAHLASDHGWMHVSPARVSTTLSGRSRDGRITQRRPPGYNLWIQRMERRWDRENAVTTHGTYYAAAYLDPGRSTEEPQ